MSCPLHNELILQSLERLIRVVGGTFNSRWRYFTVGRERVLGSQPALRGAVIQRND